MGDKVASPAAAASPTANTPAVQAVPAKKTAASPKSKKPRVKPAHPRTSEMVNAAIASLKERGGSSLQAIKKYVASTYKIDAERQAPFIKKYLKTAVTNGLLIQTKGKGASGSFKIANGKNVSSTQPQPKVQRAAAKPAAPKKTVAVAKSPKKPTVATKKVAVVKKPASAAEKRKPVKTPAAKSPKVKAPSKAKKAAKTPTRKPKAPKPKKAAVAPKAAKPAPKKTASPRKK